MSCNSYKSRRGNHDREAQVLKMLRIFLVAFVAMEGIKAERYDKLVPVEFYLRSIRNPYLARKRVLDEKKEERYMNVLQNITADLELKISVQYVSPWPQDQILEVLDFEDLCSALDKWANDTSTKSPRPDEILGLKGKRCPLEKGLITVSWYHLPTSMDLNHIMRCGRYISYVVYIESKYSSRDKRNPYFEARLTSQYRGCKNVNYGK